MRNVTAFLVIALLSSAFSCSLALAQAFNTSTPSLIWSYGTGGPILDVKAIPDVNGDNKPDMVAGSADNNVYVLNGANGSKLWNKLTNGNVVSVDYVDDVTGDGTVEIACGSSAGTVYLLNGADGDEIWSKPAVEGVPVHRVIGVLDITGDGIPDVVGGGRRQDDHDVVQSFDGTNGSSPWHKNPHAYGSPHHYNDFTVVSDVTGDGKSDVVWTYHYYARDMQLINGATGAVEQSPSGYPHDDGWVKLVPIPDVSGDGYEDVVNLRVEIGSSSGARALVLSGPTLEEIWRFEESAIASDERTWGANHISDITFDGRPEIVIGWKDQVFLMSGANGTEIWNATVTNGNAQYTRAHRITEGRDLSGDGVDDIAVGVENGKIYFLSGEDGSSVFDPYEIGGSVNAIAYMEDVNDDAFPEILVGGEDHYIYCLTVSVEKASTEVYFKLAPNPIGVGDTLTLKGILVNEYYRPLPNAIVELYARPLDGSWQYITSVATNTRGVFVWQATIPAVTGTFVFAVYYPRSEMYKSTYSVAVLVIQ